MNRNSLFIRHMSAQEVSLAVKWAALEGWNPGIHDAQCFFSADQQGFLVGMSDGVPVGCISAVRYGLEYGFIGFYIVRPEWRGQGYGLQLWNSAIEQLAGRIIGLDGVVAQQKNYQKSGFEWAYNNIRYCGSGMEKFCIDATELRQEISVIPANQLKQADLHAYDSKLFFTTRAEFLSGWLKQPQSLALAALINNDIAGYGVIRQCETGWKIGPLFAEDAAIAEKLLLSLAAYAKGEEVFWDVPEVNYVAVDLAGKYKMTKVFETARMYKGDVPRINTEKIFGVTTFELG
ncbi:MAG TPA: GNAT family N-acetyltransferase [Patescibacteria group bacterium]|nr:GNAT family N-acetyltransferase [Patescibacteria group bacterium]